jgi:hypothetical protein
MRSRRVVVGVVVFLVVVAAVAFFLVRRARAVEVGPPVALCPGPDEYGYTCEAGAEFAYIDATTDTFLYADDGIFTLELPFAFTFYGTAYSTVNISSNGNLQFATENTAYGNVCLNEAPAPEMGDMIAPYWNDLDLTFAGYVEYDVVGESPERTVVIEWDDAPRYGSTDDTVSFEVQLFEDSNDVVFLYEDAQTIEDNSGSGATIGLQSEGQGYALQFSCDQPAVGNGSVVHFPHPGGDEDDEEARIAPPSVPSTVEPPLVAKGDVALLVERLNQYGRQALPELRQLWLGQPPARRSQWQWADLTGDGRDDLVAVWHGENRQPELARLAILEGSPGGDLSLAFASHLSSRQEAFNWLELAGLHDLTGDGAADALIHDPVEGRLLVASGHGGSWQLYAVPERCDGGLAVVEDGGRLAIVRDGCGREGRFFSGWNGDGFISR